jgi:hypothetical protein
VYPVEAEVVVVVVVVVLVVVVVELLFDVIFGTDPHQLGVVVSWY